jgi:hypothetical protein
MMIEGAACIRVWAQGGIDVIPVIDEDWKFVEVVFDPLDSHQHSSDGFLVV